MIVSGPELRESIGIGSASLTWGLGPEYPFFPFLDPFIERCGDRSLPFIMS
jgi:hypothetical protein